jgi:hypothetical protein
VAATALGGCVPPPPAAPAPPPVVVVVTTQPTTDPALARAREALAAPATALAEDLLDLARRVDFARHDVPRGTAMASALEELRAVVDAAQADARALTAAVDDLGADAPRGVPAAVDQLVGLAEALATAARADADALGGVTDLDRRMDDLVAAWRARGSRSEAGPRLRERAAEAEAVAAAAGALPDTPPGCPQLRDNRLRWAGVVATRTAALAELAEAADGPGFDAALARFDAAPYGEDRAAADAESRPCWAAATPYAAAPAAVDAAVAALQAALA